MSFFIKKLNHFFPQGTSKTYAPISQLKFLRPLLNNPSLNPFFESVASLFPKCFDSKYERNSFFIHSKKTFHQRKKFENRDDFKFKKGKDNSKYSPLLGTFPFVFAYGSLSNYVKDDLSEEDMLIIKKEVKEGLASIDQKIEDISSHPISNSPRDVLNSINIEQLTYSYQKVGVSVAKAKQTDNDLGAVFSYCNTYFKCTEGNLGFSSERTQEYKTRINDIRQQAQISMPSGDMKSICKNVSDRFTDLIKQMIQDAKSDLDHLYPEAFIEIESNYAFIALGSLARKEATPYSDLEFAVLTKDDLKDTMKEPFIKISEWLHHQILLLEETPLAELNIPGLGDRDIIKKGFTLDGPLGERAPSWDPKLVSTPEKLAEIQKNSPYYKDRLFAAELYGVALIYGAPNLVTKYHQEIGKILPEKERKDRALEMLYADGTRFNMKNIKTEAAGYIIPIKYEFYRTLQLRIEWLSIYYDIPETNIFDRIQQLQKLGIFTSYAADELMEASRLIFYKRYKYYFEKTYANEDFFIQSPRNYISIYKILYTLDYYVQNFINYKDQVRDNVFQQFELFSDKITTGLIDGLVGHKESDLSQFKTAISEEKNSDKSLYLYFKLLNFQIVYRCPHKDFEETYNEIFERTENSKYLRVLLNWSLILYRFAINQIFDPIGDLDQTISLDQQIIEFYYALKDEEKAENISIFFYQDYAFQMFLALAEFYSIEGTKNPIDYIYESGRFINGSSLLDHRYAEIAKAYVNATLATSDLTPSNLDELEDIIDHGLSIYKKTVGSHNLNTAHMHQARGVIYRIKYTNSKIETEKSKELEKILNCHIQAMQIYLKHSKSSRKHFSDGLLLLAKSYASFGCNDKFKRCMNIVKTIWIKRIDQTSTRKPEDSEWIHKAGVMTLVECYQETKNDEMCLELLKNQGMKPLKHQAISKKSEDLAYNSFEIFSIRSNITFFFIKLRYEYSILMRNLKQEPACLSHLRSLSKKYKNCFLEILHLQQYSGDFSFLKYLDHLRISIQTFMNEIENARSYISDYETRMNAQIKIIDNITINYQSYISDMSIKSNDKLQTVKRQYIEKINTLIDEDSECIAQIENLFKELFDELTDERLNELFVKYISKTKKFYFEFCEDFEKINYSLSNFLNNNLLTSHKDLIDYIKGNTQSLKDSSFQKNSEKILNDRFNQFKTAIESIECFLNNEKIAIKKYKITLDFEKGLYYNLKSISGWRSYWKNNANTNSLSDDQIEKLKAILEAIDKGYKYSINSLEAIDLDHYDLDPLKLRSILKTRIKNCLIFGENTADMANSQLPPTNKSIYFSNMRDEYNKYSYILAKQDTQDTQYDQDTQDVLSLIEISLCSSLINLLKG